MRGLEDQESLAHTVFCAVAPVEIPGDYLAISGARQNLVREGFARVSHSDHTQDLAQPWSKDSLPWPQTTSVEELSIFKPLPSQKLRDASTLGPGGAPFLVSPSSGPITFKIRSASRETRVSPPDTRPTKRERETYILAQRLHTSPHLLISPLLLLHW